MSRGRLLLVDDEADIRAVASLSLERVGGWEVQTAGGAEEALAAAAEPFDVVVLDVMMPGTDGPTLLRALRAGPLPAGTPVVFLTAKVQASDRAWLAEQGAAGILEKPFDPMTLPKELERVLGSVS